MKNRKHLVNLPQTHGERSKNWRTLRAVCLLLFLSISFAAYSQRFVFKSLLKED